MNLVVSKQVTLDNALVAPEIILKIEKYNVGIEFSKPQREKAYQVTLDALKLSPCYLAFLIIDEVPEIFQICPRLLNQDFIEPPSEEDLVLFIQELGASLRRQQVLIDSENQELRSCGHVKGTCPTQDLQKLSSIISSLRTRPSLFRNMINLYTIHDDTLLDIKDSKAYKTYLNFATGKATPKKGRKFKKVVSPLRKLSPVLEEEHAVKPNRAKRPAKKSTTMPTVGVVIRDTPSESVLKKKTPTKGYRGKGMDLLSNVALLEAAQFKKTLKKSKLETHKLHASSLGDGVGSQPKVPDEQEDKATGIDEGTEASDSEKTNSDEDENPNLNQTDDEEEVYDEEYVHTPDIVEFTDDDEEYEELYKDVNVRFQATKHKEEGKRDEEMTDAGRDEGTQ
ncbi:hypothetical protein Tco_0363557 [Tanacetum coccineum]